MYARTAAFDPYFGDLCPRRLQGGRSRDRSHSGGGDVMRIEPGVVASEHLLLLLHGRVAHDELEQESVELRFGQRIGALVLHRILRGHDDERIGEHVRPPVDRHLPLLHRLEQRRLRLRGSAVDLVGEEQVREERTLAESEAAIRGGVDRLAEHVARHEVRGELHSPELHIERRSHRLHKQCLRDAWDAFEEHVAADEQRGDQSGQRAVLSDDGLRDLGAHREHRRACRLSIARGFRHERHHALIRGRRCGPARSLAPLG